MMREWRRGNKQAHGWQRECADNDTLMLAISGCVGNARPQCKVGAGRASRTVHKYLYTTCSPITHCSRSQRGRKPVISRDCERVGIRELKLKLYSQVGINFNETVTEFLTSVLSDLPSDCRQREGWVGGWWERRESQGDHAVPWWRHAMRS